MRTREEGSSSSSYSSSSSKANVAAVWRQGSFTLLCDDAFSHRFLPRGEMEAALEAAGKRVDVMWSTFVSPESYPLFFSMFAEALKKGEEGREEGKEGGKDGGAVVERFVNLIDQEEERREALNLSKETKATRRKKRKGRCSVICLVESWLC